MSKRSYARIAERAEQVRRLAIEMMGDTMHAHDDELGVLAAQICERAALLKTQAEARHEQSDPNRYDLASLPDASPIEE